MTLIGEVFTAMGMKEGRRPQVIISQGEKFAKIQFLVDSHQDGTPSWPDSLSKGDRVKLDNVVPTANWKGEIELKVDPHACVVHASSDDVGSDLMEFRARWNVTGKLVYRFEKKGCGPKRERMASQRIDAHGCFRGNES